MKKIMFLSLFLAGLCDVYSQNFQLQPYKSNFEQPVGVVFDSSGNAYVWEKGGKVKQIAPNGGNVSTVIDISGEVMSPDGDDHGLLGFALDPQFAVNGYIYLWYTVEPRTLFSGINADDQFSATIGRCTRYTYKNGAIDYNSRKVLVGNNTQYGLTDGPAIFGTTHGVGTAFFGADGNLMLSVGDGSLGDQVGPQGVTRGILPQAEQSLMQMRAQSKTSLSGKILRINKDTGDGIPGNPYYNSAQPRSAQSRMAVMGLRNPYRVTPLTQNVLGGGPGQFLVSDTGENAWEEAALYSMGDNGGWPHYEGFDNARINEQFTTFTKDPSYTFKNPLYAWAHQNNANKGWGTDSKINQNGNAVLWYNLSSDSYNHQGTSSTGNTFYPKDIIVDRYNGALANTVLAADYVGNEVMGIKFNENGTNANFSSPTRVYKAFEAGGIVHLYTNPYDGYIYVVNYNGTYGNSISRLEITGNYTPTAIIKSDKNSINQSGNTVQFYGDLSYDKETQNLQYLWNFGDGTTSTEVNPVRTFTIPNSNADKRVVTLTVTDAGGATNIATKEIYLNNNAPVIQDVVVKRSSDNSVVQALPNTYPSSTNVNISVAATDDLTSAGNLTYTMQVNRHHDDHIHYGSVINGSTTNTTFVPEGGCGEGATYWFEVLVKVKDAQGAETEFSKQIFQTCNGLQSQTITVSNPLTKISKNANPYLLNATASSGLPISFRRVSGPINVDNSGKITFTGGAGAARIILLQAGNTTYGNANPVYVDFEVNNDAMPVANFTDPFEVCTDKSVKVINNSTGGPSTSYTWKLYDGNNQVVLTNPSKDFDFTIPNSTSEWFRVELTAANSLGTNTKSGAWIAKKACNATVTPVANFAEPTTLCTNRTNTIINTSAGGSATTYLWTVQEGNQYQNILTSTSKDFVFTLPNYAASFYKVSLKATNSLGTNTKTSAWISKSQCTTTARMGNNTKAISAPNGDKPELPINKDLVYPNPTSSSINFSYDAVKNYTEYSIYDMAGREMKRGSVQDATVDIAKYPNGTYTIVFVNSTTKERATKKIIKK
ncbi:PKD domain-containing protein [Chryseobacterium indologenes]|uniref:PKD domain-containing protein n=1 Tax=Chryseobacterium indologenes TaxID=253 RepID=UPI0009A240A4|nr:PKD domain-containing protein [Chryseobacterium indologenes]